VVNEAALLAGRQAKNAVEVGELVEGVQRTKCGSNMPCSETLNPSLKIFNSYGHRSVQLVGGCASHQVQAPVPCVWTHRRSLLYD